MAIGDFFFKCDNNAQISDWNTFFAQMIVEDANGDPCFKVCDPNAGGGGGLPAVGGETFSNEDISTTTKVVPANTYKSIELVVLQGVVTLGAVTYPIGTYTIQASFNHKILNSLSYDATASTSAFLQYMA